MRRLKRLAVLTSIGAVVAASAASGADAALFFVFDRTSAAPNDRVTVRTGGTPLHFTPTQRVEPFMRPIRVYLVPNELVGDVHSRFDPRLAFVGVLVPDRRGRGVLTFSVPPLDRGDYTVAAWCPACAAFSGGRTFFVQDVRSFVEPYRSQGVLRLATTQECPVTVPNGAKPPGQPPAGFWHGNGLLWAALKPDGVYAVSPQRVEADGSIFGKLGWVTSPPERAPAVSGRRIDARAAPLRVLDVNLGSSTGATRPSWATAVLFPTAGCWRLTARVRDVSLTYVVNVVVR
jgi:hypothetical protein